MPVRRPTSLSAVLPRLLVACALALTLVAAPASGTAVAADGPVAHAAGVGLRFDLAWLGFIERTMVRIDAAKALNSPTPWQFWLGFQQPF